MDTLRIGISAILFAFILGEAASLARVRATVKGSHERYVALSWRRVCSWGVILGFAAQGVVGLAVGDDWSFLSVAFTFWLIYIEVTRHKDDDDWFRGRRRKTRKALKRLWDARPRLPARRPTTSGSPIPSPTFG